MNKTKFKQTVEKKVAYIAIKITELEVNSACPLIAYQAKLPESAKKLRKF